MRRVDDPSSSDDDHDPSESEETSCMPLIDEVAAEYCDSDRDDLVDPDLPAM